MNTFTCISCGVLFPSAELHKQHYKSDWHRYNLKRKIAELPPVRAEEFQLRVLSQRNADEIHKQKVNVYCPACQKSFRHQNAFDNHLNSKKHKDNEKNHVHVSEGKQILANEVEDKSDVEDESDIEEVDSDEWDDVCENPIDNNDCIFCLHHSHNFMENLEHMTTVHSFFVPDVEYCTDVEGLLRYLGEKISEGFMCIWCNEKGKTFYSAESARHHMVSKGHSKMIFEGIALAEYADFYDYSSSYPDAGEEIDPDEEVSVDELKSSEYELVLPSGVTVGHRSLMRYYKQSLNPNRAVVATSTKSLHKDLAQYRSLGWTEMQQKAAARKSRDTHFQKRMQNKNNMRMGIRNNKILQTYFRRQVQF